MVATPGRRPLQRTALSELSSRTPASLAQFCPSPWSSTPFSSASLNVIPANVSLWTNSGTSLSHALGSPPTLTTRIPRPPLRLRTSMWTPWNAPTPLSRPRHRNRRRRHRPATMASHPSGRSSSPPRSKPHHILAPHLIPATSLRLLFRMRDILCLILLTFMGTSFHSRRPIRCHTILLHLSLLLLQHINQPAILLLFFTQQNHVDADTKTWIDLFWNLD